MSVVSREFLDVGHQWQPQDLFGQQHIASIAGEEMGLALGIILHLPSNSSNEQIVQAANMILDRAAVKSPCAERCIMQAFYRAASAHSSLAIALEHRAEAAAPAYFAASPPQPHLKIIAF